MDASDADPTQPAVTPPTVSTTDGEGLSSRALIATDRADRYAKQLASHLARRLETSWDETTGRGVVRFDAGHCDLSREADGLGLHAVVDAALPAEEQSALIARIEDVVGRHLVRFGSRDELVAEWHRSDGTPGGVFRHTEEPDAHQQG